MNTLVNALSALSDDSVDEYTETIINALTLYNSWHAGFSRVSASSGHHEASANHIIEAQKSAKLLSKLTKETK